MKTSSSSAKSSRIRIAVRVRPLSDEEVAKGHVSVIERVNNNGVRVWDPTCLQFMNIGERSHAQTSSWSRDFFYDHCLWSVSPLDSNFASQQSIFEAVGRQVVDFVLEGYNTCVLAYGQTGAGKSYTMLGSSRDSSHYGLIPRVCFALFEDLEAAAGQQRGNEFTVDFSYLEIYNETLRDCLSPANKADLKLRESREGIVVTNITTERVYTFEDVMTLIAHGNKFRTVAATNANARSSRSHAIVTLSVSQRYRADMINGLPSSALQHKTSRVHLVDLAGSERQSHSGATGLRLREANNINKSLSVLGDVIKFLGEGRGHVPYRNSCLTMVLKESLGGNSHTAIVATVSPSNNDYDETISTLKYADSAKRIRMRVAANVTSGFQASDGSTALQLVPLLQAEVAKLKEMLKTQQLQSAKSLPTSFHSAAEPAEDVNEMKARVEELEQQLREREDLIKSFHDNSILSQDHGRDQMNVSTSVDRESSRSSFLQPLVLLSDDAVDTTIPRIVNLNQDPLFSECLVYYIPEGFATAGCDEANVDVFLSGPDVLPKHCVFHYHNGSVTISTLGSITEEEEAAGIGLIYVNGINVRSLSSDRKSRDAHQVRLNHFDRIAIGRFHLFRFEAAGMHRAHSTAPSSIAGHTSEAIPSVPDWEFAQNELMRSFKLNPFADSFSGSEKLETGFGNRHSTKLSEQDNAPNSPQMKSILRRSSDDERRRVRFSDELVFEPTEDNKRVLEDAKRQQSLQKQIEEVSRLPKKDLSSQKDEEDYWNRVDRVIKGVEKATNPGELRSMMRAALERTGNEHLDPVQRYDQYKSSQLSEKPSSVIAAPEYTHSPIKSKPTEPSAYAPMPDREMYNERRNILKTEAGGDSVPPPPQEVRAVKKIDLAPETVYNIDIIHSVTRVPQQPLSLPNDSIQRSGEKFDSEVLALQSELAQMQKNLQDRMNKYKSIIKR